MGREDRTFRRKVHEVHVRRAAAELRAIFTLQRGAADDARTASAALGIDVRPDRRQPWRTVGVVEGNAGGHLRDVRGRMQIVTFQERPAQAMREGVCQRGLARARYAHDDDVGHARATSPQGGQRRAPLITPNTPARPAQDFVRDPAPWETCCSARCPRHDLFSRPYFASRSRTRSSTTEGSANVVVSPRFVRSFAAILRRMRRMILPERVLGRPGAH